MRPVHFVVPECCDPPRDHGGIQHPLEDMTDVSTTSPWGTVQLHPLDASCLFIKRILVEVEA